MDKPVRITRRRLLNGTSGLLLLGGAACATAAPTQAPAPQPAAPAPKPTTAPAAEKTTAAAKPAPTAAPKVLEPVKWRVGFSSVPFFDNSFRTIGVKQGYYRDAGIDIEFLHGANNLQNKALIAGEIQSIDLAIDGILSAVEQGAGLKIVGSAQPGLPYAIYAKKEIRSVADFAGRTVAVASQGDFPHTVTRALLAQAGVPEERVTVVAIGQGGPNLVQALMAGKIDAYTNPIDYVPFIETDPSLHVVGFVPDVLPNLVRTAVTVRTQTTEQQGDVVTRFLTAMLRSVRYGYDHKSELLADAEERTKLEMKQLEFLYDWYRDHKMWSLNLHLDPKSVEYMQELNLKLGLQEKRLPIDRVLDLSFQQKVVAQLGEVKG